MLTSESDATIVNATIQLGHNLGLRVVAEGVENRQIFNTLRSMGCDLQQGYFIGKPLPAETITSWESSNTMPETGWPTEPDYPAALTVSHLFNNIQH
jgi:EAL domain-containing protein (putative c-di-GMP-specific phosphodiesterase class I)